MKLDLISMLGIWIIISTSTALAKEVESDLMGLPVPCYDLWYRYYGAGEKALKSHDEALAKRNFLASLAELEKVTTRQSSKDLFFMVRISGIEKRLTDLYTNKVTATTGDDQKELAVRKEQVEVLDRLARVNRRIITPNDRLVIASQERYEAARKQYEKRANEIKNKTPENKTNGDALTR